MRDLEITPWFGGESITLHALEGTDQVAFSWSTISGVPDEPKTIEHLLVWHNCSKSNWVGDSTRDQSRIPDYVGWHPAGVGLHDLISADPLHIEASVYWPDCCGLHGFIRDGRWVPA